MAYGKPEQIDSARDWFIKGNHRSTFRNYLKKVAKKRHRILGKKLLDNAPKKNAYKGWEF